VQKSFLRAPFKKLHIAPLEAPLAAEASKGAEYSSLCRTMQEDSLSPMPMLISLLGATDLGTTSVRI